MRQLKEITQEIGDKRLLKLARLLEKNAENRKGTKFSLNGWASRKKKARGPLGTTELVPVLFKRRPKKVPLTCNTTACAFGYAAICGAFRRDGLSYEVNEQSDGTCLVPSYRDRIGFDAARAFFALSRPDALRLFHPDHYEYYERNGSIGERAVAKRIRDLVASRAGVGVIRV